MRIRFFKYYIHLKNKDQTTTLIEKNIGLMLSLRLIFSIKSQKNLYIS